MIIDKLPWCAHKGEPIFSVHVQSDGNRFATGGGDNRVKVWKLAAAVDARQEENETVPKLLATLTDHNGPVNVVRFSQTGRQLASGSDDKMACVFELRPGAGGGVLGAEANVENWRTRLVLRGHSSNVTDLGWSPDDTRIATASLDCTVMIWDAATGQRVTTLAAHTSFVKGVAWDPIGTYLATQSEDKSVKVWRTDDWNLVAAIATPFARIVTSTFATRLSWSPDGQHLLAGNSYQGATHSAVAVPRGAWDSPAQYTLVSGHSGAVVSVSYCPRLVRLPAPGGGAGAGAPSEELSAVFALGAQDKRITVWGTAAQRPLVCGQRLFKSMVMDLAWTPDGRCLLAASSDGTVAYLQFERWELGEAASEAETAEVMKVLYGVSAGRPGRRIFAESAEQLRLEERLAGDGAGAVEAVGQARTALAAVQRPEAEPSAATGAMAALDARLGGRMGAGATTQTGFGFGAGGAAPGAAAPAAAAAPKPRRVVPADGSLMPPPPRQVQAAPQAEAATKPAKRARLEQVPTAAAAAAAASPLLLLAVPRPQPELTAQLGIVPVLLGGDSNGGSGLSAQLRIANKERGAGGVPQAELCCSHGGKAAWTDVIRGAVVAAAGTPHFSAAATADGRLVLYSAAGRRLAAPLKLGAGVAVLAAGCEWRLLALTSAACVKVLDVERMEEVLEAPAGPLLQGGASVAEARLSRCGSPILSLSDSTAYVWHAALRAWMCVVDDSLAASQFAPLMKLPDHGELSALQAEALGAGAGGSRPTSVASAAQRQLSRAHAEGNLAAALALRSADEYRRWLVSYVRCLADAGDAGRLTELCDSMMGPSPAEEESGGGEEPAPPRWCPTVLGLSKRALLREEVLREMARNRALGSLLQRCSEALDEIQAGEGRAV